MQGSAGAYPSISQPRLHYNRNSLEEATPGSAAYFGTRPLVDEPLTSCWRCHVERCGGFSGRHASTDGLACTIRWRRFVHNPGQIMNSHVKEFIRRRFLFDSLKEGGTLKEDGWPRPSSEA